VRRPGIAAVLGSLACANIGTPPGGPVRTEPPQIVRVTPDSGAVNVREDRVTFHFDAVVSDRPSGQASTLEGLFLISPRDGTPRVSWERDRIQVRPRRGFQPNTAYSVTLLPGVTDLRGNASPAGRTIIFSTGPTIPAFSVQGRAYDWMNERPAPNALVEVLRRSDSLLYVGRADSVGQFAIGPLDEGSYVVRAILDANRNGALDATESWDSVGVTVRGASPFVELLAAPRDTIGPRLLTVAVQDSVTMTANFDRPLDPTVPLMPALFRVLASDSTALVVARVTARSRETAADTAAPPSAAAVPAQPAQPARPPADTVRRALVPRPSMPAPAVNVVIQLDSSSALRPGATYRVVAVNARGLQGAVRTSDRVITVARTRADSVQTVPRP
jgi:hypothetical protein